jgi:hypothetical protein
MNPGDLLKYPLSFVDAPTLHVVRQLRSMMMTRAMRSMEILLVPVEIKGILTLQRPITSAPMFGFAHKVEIGT